MNVQFGSPVERLTTVLQEFPALAIAVSGGVDSLTLASVAQRRMETPPLMVHATSAAVPAAHAPATHTPPPTRPPRLSFHRAPRRPQFRCEGVIPNGTQESRRLNPQRS